MPTRQTIDCRSAPHRDCTLTISGREEEVLRAALTHACSVHGRQGDERTRAWLRSVLRPASSIVPQEGRKVLDCRLIPSELGCTLSLSGREDEVVRAATDHAIEHHREAVTADLESLIRASLVDETRYVAEPVPDLR